VAREHDGGASACGLVDELVAQITSGTVEPRVRLVEEPQGRAPCDQRREAHAALLSGGELTTGRRREPTGEADALE
jgi:hypothetical protein